MSLRCSIAFGHVQQKIVLICIAIRIARRKGGRAFVRSGTGIVAGPVPETAYQECINKAKAILSALTPAQGKPFDPFDRQLRQLFL